MLSPFVPNISQELTANAYSKTTTAASATGAVFAGLGFVDGQGTAAQQGTVHGGNGFIATVRHLHECETPAPPGLAIGNNLRTGDRAVLAERLRQFFARGLERDVPHVQLLAHDTLSKNLTDPRSP